MALSAAERLQGATLLDALAWLEERGFPGQFAARPGGQVLCLQCRVATPAGDVPLRRAFRVEGMSDPAEQTLVAGVVCPTCASRGTLVMAYGPMSAPEDGEVAQRLLDQRPGAR